MMKGARVRRSRLPRSWPQPPSLIKRERRLILVSNRLPIMLRKDREERWSVQPGSGGLVTALAPVLEERGGTWIGWPGTGESDGSLEQAVTEAGTRLGYTLKPVMLSPAEVEGYYAGFANEVLWPLFHDLQSLCNFELRYWQSYREVNRRFAKVISQTATGEDFIWIHDYHLMHVAADLRRLGLRSNIGFFLHSPFPPLDIFLKLPWRSTLLQALLHCDLIGLQTLRDRRNLVQCLQSLVKGIKIQGKGQVLTVATSDRQMRIGHFPISIDYTAFVKRAATRAVADQVKELRARLPGGKLIFSVDRLDYTKGIPHRLQAFRSALARYPELRGRVSLLQVVVPSRVDVPEYVRLKTAIEELVGAINGEWAQPGDWLPVWYVFGSLSDIDLIAYYRAADIALVTPLKDGMNLVAKEYCACSIDDEGVLILSEFAGAAAQLGKGALLVNPYDTEGVADAIRRACCISEDQRQARMRRLRRSVRKYNVFRWADAFMRVALVRPCEGECDAVRPTEHYEAAGSKIRRRPDIGPRAEIVSLTSQ
ncbi:MAG: alpha,alpha-trehalose-phosphate synthase (UDP-forming) [Gammaproteobacteria bacterium]